MRVATHVETYIMVAVSDGGCGSSALLPSEAGPGLPSVGEGASSSPPQQQRWRRRGQRRGAAAGGIGKLMTSLLVGGLVRFDPCALSCGFFDVFFGWVASNTFVRTYRKFLGWVPGQPRPSMEGRIGLYAAATTRDDGIGFTIIIVATAASQRLSPPDAAAIGPRGIKASGSGGLWY